MGAHRFLARTKPEHLVVYAAMASVGSVLNGIGSTVAFLERDLALTPVQTGLYPLFVAIALLGVSLRSDDLVAAIGRRMALWLAVTVMLVGAVLFASEISWEASAAGAVVIGIGVAVALQIVPAMLFDARGSMSVGPLAKSQAMASTATLLTPLLIALAITVGTGWRAGFLFLPLVAFVTLTSAIRKTVLTPIAEPRDKYGVFTRGEHAVAWSFWRRWFDVVLVVAVEFCMLYWTASYLVTQLDISKRQAALMTAIFLGGMAAGRAAGGKFGDHIVDLRRAYLAALVLSGCGFGLFWSFDIALTVAVGLLLTGLGVALLTPIAIVRGLTQIPGRSDYASARNALAPGVAIAAGPFLLAGLASAVGLRLAFILVPLLLAAAFANGFHPRGGLARPDLVPGVGGLR